MFLSYVSDDMLAVLAAWDFFSDSLILFTKVIGQHEGECKAKIESLVLVFLTPGECAISWPVIVGLQVIPWLICWAIATIASLVALYVRVKIFRTVF